MNQVDELNALLGIGPPKPRLPITLQKSGYEAVRSLGKGGFGQALLIFNKEQNKYFVAKHVNLAGMSHKQRADAHNEITMLQRMKHPNIVRYVEFCEERPNLYIIMEYADGGDVYSHIKKLKQQGRLMTEQQAMNLFVQTTLAIKFMHDQLILHRDIKAQNVFLTRGHVVKLGDFGISTVLNNTMAMAQTMCGTPCYFSPELCQGKPYNNKSDVWALGILLYEMCAMRLPFEATNVKKLMDDILRVEPPRIPARFSDDVADLVRQLMRKDPRRRPDVDGILAHPAIRRAGADILRDLEPLVGAPRDPPRHGPAHGKPPVPVPPAPAAAAAKPYAPGGAAPPVPPRAKYGLGAGPGAAAPAAGGGVGLGAALGAQAAKPHPHEALNRRYDDILGLNAAAGAGARPAADKAGAGAPSPPPPGAKLAPLRREVERDVLLAEPPAKQSSPLQANNAVPPIVAGAAANAAAAGRQSPLPQGAGAGAKQPAAQPRKSSAVKGPGDPEGLIQAHVHAGDTIGGIAPSPVLAAARAAREAREALAAAERGEVIKKKPEPLVPSPPAAAVAPPVAPPAPQPAPVLPPAAAPSPSPPPPPAAAPPADDGIRVFAGDAAEAGAGGGGAGEPEADEDSAQGQLAAVVERLKSLTMGRMPMSPQRKAAADAAAAVAAAEPNVSTDMPQLGDVPSQSKEGGGDDGAAFFVDRAGTTLDLQAAKDAAKEARLASLRAVRGPDAEDRAEPAGGAADGPAAASPAAAAAAAKGGATDEEDDIAIEAKCLCGEVSLSTWVSAVYGTFTCACQVCRRFSGAAAGVEWLHLPEPDFAEVLQAGSNTRAFAVDGSTLFSCAACGSSLAAHHSGFEGCVVSKAALVDASAAYFEAKAKSGGDNASGSSPQAEKRK